MNKKCTLYFNYINLQIRKINLKEWSGSYNLMKGIMNDHPLISFFNPFLKQNTGFLIYIAEIT